MDWRKEVWTKLLEYFLKWSAIGQIFSMASKFGKCLIKLTQTNFSSIAIQNLSFLIANYNSSKGDAGYNIFHVYFSKEIFHTLYNRNHVLKNTSYGMYCIKKKMLTVD
jgi:hypothetical protein